MKNAAIALTLVTASCAHPVMAQEVKCAPLSHVISVITEGGQEPVFEGATGDGVNILVFRDKDGTWIAMAVNQAAGMACLLASGAESELPLGKPNV